MSEIPVNEGESRSEAKRRPIQFGLRTLLFGTAIVAVLLATHRYLPVPLYLSLMVITIALVMLVYKIRPKFMVAMSLAALLLVGVWSVSLAYQAVLVEMRGAGCSSNMKNVLLALHNYHDDYGSFPPAYIADETGKPMHSWRVLILPYLESQALYDQYRFDEPWNGPNNRKLHDQEPWGVFHCPLQKDGSGIASYFAVVGPGTAWPGTKATRFRDFRDGTSATILLVEVADSGIHWMEPRDLHINQMAMEIGPAQGQGISSHHHWAAGNTPIAQVGFCDSAVHAIVNPIDPDLLRGLLTVAGGEDVSEYFQSGSEER